MMRCSVPSSRGATACRRFGPQLVAALLLVGSASEVAGQRADANEARLLRGRVQGAPSGVPMRAIARFEVDTSQALLLGATWATEAATALSTQVDERGNFRFAPRGLQQRFVVRVISEDGRFASELRRGRLDGDPVALRVRPAAKLMLPRDELLAYTLLAFDRELREYFVLAAGRNDEMSDGLVLPPGQYRLRLVADDARARDFAVQLLPGSEHAIAQPLQRPALLRFVRSGAEGPSSLRLAPSLLGPTQLKLGTRDLAFKNGVAELALPALDLACRYWLESPGMASIAGLTPPLLPESEQRIDVLPGSAREVTIESEVKARAVLLQDHAWRDLPWSTKLVFEVDGERTLRGLAHLPGLLVAYETGGDGALRCGHAFVGAQTERVALRLVAAASIEVVVHQSDASPARAARIRAWPLQLAAPDGHQSEAGLVGARVTDLVALHPTIDVVTDRRGRCTLDSLLPGRWVLRIDAPPHCASELVLDLSAGERERVTQRLELGLALRGRVLLPNGEAAEGVLVEVDDPLPSPRVAVRRTFADANGDFVVTGLVDARYRIEASRSIGARRELARGAARPGEELTLHLVDEDPVRR